jgi:hypothetical protein
MIIVEAWAEPTGMNDTAAGKPIFVTTSARITFRKAFPKAQKIRNSVLNTAIATIFSASKTAERFKPYNKHNNYIPGTMGVIRPAGGGRFIGIVGNDFVKIVEFKGSPPQLTLPEVSKKDDYSWKGGDPSMSTPDNPSSTSDPRGAAGVATDDLLSAMNG